MEASWLADLWQAAKVGGPAMTIMTLLWYLERTDRLRLQKERDALLERCLNALNSGNTVLEGIKDAIKELGRR
jgi:hypothetical protein